MYSRRDGQKIEKPIKSTKPNQVKLVWVGLNKKIDLVQLILTLKNQLGWFRFK